jgi:putative ABC transport system permease protein
MPAIERPAGPVVGVVENFHFRSLHDPIGPILFFLPPTPDWLTYFTVRLQPDAVGEALAALEAEWTQLDPDHPFEYQFFDEAFAQLHAEEERTGRIAAALSLIAALVACVGLFGLAAYSAVRRTKEIGIRKALGAGVSQVAGLLSAEFLRLVGIAFVIATPVAWYLMAAWLADFAYNVGIQWQIFAGAALALFGLTLVTVAYQAIRAALADPVKSLRYE